MTHPVPCAKKVDGGEDNESIKRRKHILDELNKFGEVTVIKLSEVAQRHLRGSFVAISPYWV